MMQQHHQQQSLSSLDLMSPSTATKIARIQSWSRGAQLTAHEPHSPHSPSSASTVSRRHSVPPTTSPRSEAFDVRMMPAPPVPQVHVHLAEPRPVLHHKHSHAASLHSWGSQDIESQVGLRLNDADERSTAGRELTWKERARRASRALFGQSTPLPAWSALNVEKNTTSRPQHQELDVEINLNSRSESQMGQYKCNCDCNKHASPKRKRTRMCLCILVILLILLAVVDVIFLNVRVLNPDFGIIQPTVTPTPTNLSRDGMSAPIAPTATATATRPSTETDRPSSTTVAASSTASVAPSVLQNCLTQFQLNAPSAPESYPCDTCFSALSGAPSNAGADPTNTYFRFCAMKAIFDSAGSSGSASNVALSGAGWMKDAKPCGWSGVTCDNNGNINNIILTFPGVPAAIPTELSSISTLTSLKITGNGDLPSGSLPALRSLTNLDLENTGLSSFADDAFSAVNTLNSLTLVRNLKMGSSLPSSIGSLSLRIVNGQALTSLDIVLSSSSLASSLQTLDLSSNSIASTLPSDLSGMKTLAELNLSGNDISSPFPAVMPTPLQVLNLEGNSKLGGALPSAMCSSSTLTQCDLRSTGLGGQTVTCGASHIHTALVILKPIFRNTEKHAAVDIPSRDAIGTRQAPALFVSRPAETTSTQHYPKMADHGHSHEGGDHGHSHDGPHAHSHSPQPGQGPPQQLLNPDPIDPALLADMDANFKPRPVKLVGPEGNTTCQVVCPEHSTDKCDECGVDYTDLNLLARMLVQAPNLIVPPPPQVTDKNRSAHVSKFKDEGNVSGCPA
ncbi:leucine rich repeats (2 copies) domain-containing protein [Rhizoctonia solani AG-1 IA]|uniref:Leucine rich repeats (2 copies) domain-containing protein n=1 Tax=Thanatephorus cucumeris (strain AG1-IA) TaxID=983506 RepID=L8X2T0_THACA|nr:leucine rich repeats (2 copies) domain-containing protein [Rhizoctonia solani AG-1 IA]